MFAFKKDQLFSRESQEFCILFEEIEMLRHCSIDLFNYRKNPRKNKTILFLISLKGQCHEIFDFWFFSWISFPQASESTFTAISNCFENSRRYSWLKVHHWCQRHRWQMEKIFKQKNFNNFVWAPLGSRVNIYCIYIFAFKFTLRRLQPDIVLIICHRCRWHRWCTLTCEYLREFSKKFETVLMGHSGAGGKLIHTKNQKQKISWHCTFKLLGGGGSVTHQGCIMLYRTCRL
jgi:hypothetical protein